MGMGTLREPMIPYHVMKHLRGLAGPVRRIAEDKFMERMASGDIEVASLKDVQEATAFACKFFSCEELPPTDSALAAAVQADIEAGRLLSIDEAMKRLYAGTDTGVGR